jgi:hypothetical protein
MTKPVVSLGQSQAKMVVAWTPRDADRTESLIAAHATCKKKTFFKIKQDRSSLIIKVPGELKSAVKGVRFGPLLLVYV